MIERHCILTFIFFSFIFISWRLITTFQWVLSYIDMNQPWSYMYSPSRSPFPPPSPHGFIRHLSVSSVAQPCLTLWDPMNCSTQGFPVHHQLPELAQTHFHPVGDAIQPSHPLSSPSPPAFSLSQHQGLF